MLESAWLDRSGPTLGDAIHGYGTAMVGGPFRAPRRLTLDADPAHTEQVERLCVTGFFSQLEALTVIPGGTGALVRRVLDAAPQLNELCIGRIEDPREIAHDGVRFVRWLGESLDSALEMPALRGRIELRLPDAGPASLPGLADLLPLLSGLSLTWWDTPKPLLRRLTSRVSGLQHLDLTWRADIDEVTRLVRDVGPGLRRLALTQSGSDALPLPKAWGSPLTSLDALALSGFVGGDGWLSLPTGLRTFEVSRLDSVDDVQRLCSALSDRLTSLSLSTSPGAEAPLGQVLTRNLNLQELSLSGFIDDGMAWDSMSPSLRSLSLNRMTLCATQFWSALERHSMLRALRISTTQIDGAQPAGLPPSLQRLDLGWCRPDAEWLALLIWSLRDTRLRTLGLAYTSLGELDALAPYLPALQALHLDQVDGFDPSLLDGAQHTLRDLLLTDRYGPDPLDVRRFSTWFAGHTWPALECVRAPQWLALEDVAPALSAGQLPRLRDLACHVEDVSVLRAYLADASAHRLGRLTLTGTVPPDVYRMAQPDPWPRTTVG